MLHTFGVFLLWRFSSTIRSPTSCSSPLAFCLGEVRRHIVVYAIGTRLKKETRIEQQATREGELVEHWENGEWSTDERREARMGALKLKSTCVSC